MLNKNQILQCLGGPWPEIPTPAAAIVETRQMDGYEAQLLRYDIAAAEPDGSTERIEAWMLIPADAADDAGEMPGVLVWHQHNDQFHLGKSEPAGFAGDPSQALGPLLAREGYVVLCPDAAGFESRQHPKLPERTGERHEFMKELARGRSLAWKNIRECRCAVDVLTAQNGVDQNRIGCIGHSLGSTLSWLTGPWEERLQVIVGNCCMPSMASIEEAEINHSFSNYIPGLLIHGDIPDYVGLCAPRRLHLNFGAADLLNPIQRIRDEMPVVEAAFAEAGAAESFSWFIDEKAGHEISPMMWEKALGVLNEKLRPAARKTGEQFSTDYY